MNLAKFPRHKLTFGPTPIEKLDRLSEHLGGRVEVYLPCAVPSVNPAAVCTPTTARSANSSSVRAPA